jgi:hypothetical protein
MLALVHRASVRHQVVTEKAETGAPTADPE